MSKVRYSVFFAIALCRRNELPLIFVLIHIAFFSLCYKSIQNWLFLSPIASGSCWDLRKVASPIYLEIRSFEWGTAQFLHKTLIFWLLNSFRNSASCFKDSLLFILEIPRSRVRPDWLHCSILDNHSLISPWHAID